MRSMFTSLKENQKYQLVAAIVILLIVVVVVGIGVTVLNLDSAEQDQTAVVELTNQEPDDVPSAEVARFIDGVEVEFGKENIYPVGVMIENLVSVRPQSGLQNAQVVYEALAEGGITRFLAVYAGGEEISSIGPVRSARPYYVDWAEEYEGMYAHVGGSPQALSQLYGNEYIEDLDQISGDHAYFWREQSLSAPHNVFTSSELLGYAMRDKKGDEVIGTYTPWRFEKQLKKKERPKEEKKISLNFSSYSYDVEYVYDRDENHYLRSNGGEPHTDALSSKQLSVRNIVCMYAPTSLLEADTGRLQIDTQGEGSAVFFNNGRATSGTWKKEEAERTRFFTDQEDEFSFIPGNIWIEVLPEDHTIEYN